MRHILLVDDHEEDLALLARLIVREGYKHAAAMDGAEALAMARKSRPALVISDLLLPVLDGYSLLREWKSDTGLMLIPFIVYTATYTDSDDEQLALDLGADAFISKTSDPQELLAQVKQLLALAGRPPAPERLTRVLEAAQLKQYNSALVRKLKAKTRQFHSAKQALHQEIARGREIARTQVAVLDALAANVALIDARGVILAVNEAWRRQARANHLGSADYGVGEDYLAVSDGATGMYAAEAVQAAAGIRAVLSGSSSSFVLEYPCNQENAPTSWFRMIVTPMGSGGSARAVVMHVDVTDLRGAQKKLQESEAQYLQLLNSTADGIYRLDGDGVCTFCNPTAARLLGYADPAQVVGRSAHEHHHRCRADGSPFPARECKVHPSGNNADRAHGDDEVFFRADGSQFPVEYWSEPIKVDSIVKGRVVTFLDITQRRNLEAQFLQSQKMEAVGRLAGGVAHDFNNALQVIFMYGELLEERLVADPEGSEHNRQIMLAGLRAAALTRQLLALSRKQILRPELLDLSTATSDIEEMLRRTIGEDIKLTINRFAHVGTIEADRAQIQQILINLTLNARDAMPSGGELVISTSNCNVVAGDVLSRDFIKEGRYAVVSVRDTGTGMDPATLSRIFEPFFTTKDPSKGTGLGLSTVYGIVKQSKGYVLVDSEPGKGSDFRLFFPVVSGSAQQATPPRPRRTPLRGTETIFVVEDENSLRAVVADTLRANGYRVLEAHEGNAAIEFAYLFADPIDLLLTDVILPGLSGRAVADRLQLSRPTIKIMYMSGYTDDFIADHGIIVPGTVLLEKPFPISMLLLKVRETLDGKLADTESEA